MPHGRKFADSPLEEAGFELMVPRRRPVSLVLSFSFTPTFRLARMQPTNPISKACVGRGPMVQIRLPPAPLCCELGRKPGRQFPRFPRSRVAGLGLVCDPKSCRQFAR
jgi:hypothetical protein